jgi:hypothetical protein
VNQVTIVLALNAVLETIAWPIVVIIGLVLFREPIGHLIKNMERFKTPVGSAKIYHPSVRRPAAKKLTGVHAQPLGPAAALVAALEQEAADAATQPVKARRSKTSGAQRE